MGADMKVVMLTRNVDEGEAFAKLAGMAMHDVVIPQTASFVHGLRLTSDDLIIEFPSFVGHPHETGIRQSIHTVLRMCKADPPWQRITE
jgi:hypothetical protein